MEFEEQSLFSELAFLSSIIIRLQREELLPLMIMLLQQQVLILPLEQVPFTVVEADLLHISKRLDRPINVSELIEKHLLVEYFLYLLSEEELVLLLNQHTFQLVRLHDDRELTRE